jgi:hypothetical protein
MGMSNGKGLGDFTDRYCINVPPAKNPSSTGIMLRACNSHHAHMW